MLSNLTPSMHNAQSNVTTLWWVLISPPPSPTSSQGQTHGALGQQARFGVPISCAAVALIRSADDPQAVRVCRDGEDPRSFEEGDRAASRLLWRHQRIDAEELAASMFAEPGIPPRTGEEPTDQRRCWVRSPISYPTPLRDAVVPHTEVLFDMADRSCLAPGAGRR